VLLGFGIELQSNLFYRAQQSDDENGELVKEMVSQLRDMESMSANSPTKSPSKDLSGTLKNLKKLEQVILGMFSVLAQFS